MYMSVFWHLFRIVLKFSVAFLCFKLSVRFLATGLGWADGFSFLEYSPGKWACQWTLAFHHLSFFPPFLQLRYGGEAEFGVLFSLLFQTLQVVRKSRIEDGSKWLLAATRFSLLRLEWQARYAAPRPIWAIGRVFKNLRVQCDRQTQKKNYPVYKEPLDSFKVFFVFLVFWSCICTAESGTCRIFSTLPHPFSFS